VNSNIQRLITPKCWGSYPTSAYELTIHEKQDIFLEKEKAQGYLKKGIMFHKDIITAVEKYAKSVF